MLQMHLLVVGERKEFQLEFRLRWPSAQRDGDYGGRQRVKEGWRGEKTTYSLVKSPDEIKA